MSDTHPQMAVHLSRSAKQRRAAILAMAIAAGGIAFTYASGDDGASGPGDLGPGGTQSTASVLGVVVTQDSLPTAPPASPATIDDEVPSGTSATTRPGTTSTTRPGPSLIPPTVIENTTTTTDATTPSTIDLSTTSSTEAPTTTEVPPG